MANEDLLALYKTATEMMRHFHSQLDRHRLVVVTVGLIVLAASGKLLLDSRNPLNACRYLDFCLLSPSGLMLIT